MPSSRIDAAPTLANLLTGGEARDWPSVGPPAAEAQAVDPNELPNELIMSLVIAEASRRAGKYVGPSGVTALKDEIRTLQHARAFFAARLAKKK